MKTAKFAGLLLAALFLTSVSVYAQSEPGPSKGQSLYQRLGEAPGVRLLVDSWAFRVKSDKRVAHYFKQSGMDQFKKCMTECMTMMTGGKAMSKRQCCNSQGCMRTVKMSGADFDALIEDLGWAADKNAVGKWQKEQLMTRMQALRGTCVDHKGMKPAKGSKATAPKTTKKAQNAHH